MYLRLTYLHKYLPVVRGMENVMIYTITNSNLSNKTNNASNTHIHNFTRMN